ncbi:hypothetical protein E3N88_20333 [Mikania micrantha]|uniref:Uncharacterized protein n=1 Tax=Mikania micrantha TaxID=192012 RepID=A0A5N6NID6_9ASTR|nr:hypothetical protein E3N88_20333 [Mikania micrantha]
MTTVAILKGSTAAVVINRGCTAEETLVFHAGGCPCSRTRRNTVNSLFLSLVNWSSSLLFLAFLANAFQHLSYDNTLRVAEVEEEEEKKPRMSVGGAATPIQDDQQPHLLKIGFPMSLIASLVQHHGTKSYYLQNMRKEANKNKDFGIKVGSICIYILIKLAMNMLWMQRMRCTCLWGEGGIRNISFLSSYGSTISLANATNAAPDPLLSSFILLTGDDVGINAFKSLIEPMAFKKDTSKLLLKAWDQQQ